MTGKLAGLVPTFGCDASAVRTELAKRLHVKDADKGAITESQQVNNNY